MEEKGHTISDGIAAVAKVWLIMALCAAAVYFIVLAIEENRSESINVFAIFQKKEDRKPEVERVPVEVPESEEVEV